MNLIKNGIVYFVVIAPNKHSIYPEYLPEDLRPTNNPLRIDQLLAALKERNITNIIDSRSLLKSAKKEQQLYYKTDTHWNSVAGYLVPEFIASKLKLYFPDIQLNQKALPPIRHKLVRGGDLFRNLGISSEG